MILLSLLFTLILFEIGKDLLEKGRLIYQNPRFWAHLTTITLIIYIAAWC